MVKILLFYLYIFLFEHGVLYIIYEIQFFLPKMDVEPNTIKGNILILTSGPVSQ